MGVRDPWSSGTLLEAQAMAGVGVWEWCVDEGTSRWSDELCRIYGFDPESYEHDYARFIATVVPEDRPLVERAVRDALDHGRGYDFEMRIVAEDGMRRTVHAVGAVTVDSTGRTTRILGTTQDITDRSRAEAALSDSERRFRAAFDDAAIGMALVAADGTFLRVNRVVEVILGRPADELLRMTFQEVTHPEDLAADVEHVRELLSGEADSYSMEKRYLRPGGEIVCARLSVSVVRDPQGAPEYFVSQIQDVSEERRLREHLHHLADHDSLTGLRNRRRFDEDLAVQAARCDRYDEHAAVVLLDLNGFKAVNDTHGHHVGDDVLRRVAGVVRGRLRSTDCAARIGGDEFAVLLLQATLTSAKAVAAEIAAAIRGCAGHGVTAAHGVALLAPGVSPEQAMRNADRAMYLAKAVGTANAA